MFRRKKRKITVEDIYCIKEQIQMEECWLYSITTWENDLYEWVEISGESPDLYNLYVRAKTVKIDAWRLAYDDYDYLRF